MYTYISYGVLYVVNNYVQRTGPVVEVSAATCAHRREHNIVTVYDIASLILFIVLFSK
jgi:hypothetical protein